MGSSPTASRSLRTRPSIAAYLAEKAGYRTALLGKAHFEPGFDLDAQVAGELAAPATARPARGAGSTGRSRRMHAAAFNEYPIAHLTAASG